MEREPQSGGSGSTTHDFKHSAVQLDLRYFQIESFNFPTFQNKMYNFFQYIANYKNFREGLLHKGWVELFHYVLLGKLII